VSSACATPQPSKAATINAALTSQYHGEPRAALRSGQLGAAGIGQPLGCTFHFGPCGEETGLCVPQMCKRVDHRCWPFCQPLKAAELFVPLKRVPGQ